MEQVTPFSSSTPTDTNNHTSSVNDSWFGYTVDFIQSELEVLKETLLNIFFTCRDFLLPCFEEINSLKETNRKLQNDITNLTETNKTQKTEISELTESKEKVERINTTLSGRPTKESMDELTENQKKSLEDLETRLKEMSNTKVVELENKIKEKGDAFTEIKILYDQSVIDLDKLTNAKNQLQNELEITKRQLEERPKQVDIDQLNETITELKKVNEEQKNEIERLEEENRKNKTPSENKDLSKATDIPS